MRNRQAAKNIVVQGGIEFEEPQVLIKTNRATGEASRRFASHFDGKVVSILQIEGDLRIVLFKMELTAMAGSFGDPGAGGQMAKVFDGFIHQKVFDAAL